MRRLRNDLPYTFRPPKHQTWLRPPVIFPEGEIYHHHRRLDPLNEGVASILLKVAAWLPAGKSAFLVPLGLRFFHDPKVEVTFRDRLSRLEDRIGQMQRAESMAVENRRHDPR